MPALLPRAKHAVGISEQRRGRQQLVGLVEEGAGVLLRNLLCQPGGGEDGAGEGDGGRTTGKQNPRMPGYEAILDLVQYSALPQANANGAACPQAGTRRWSSRRTTDTCAANGAAWTQATHKGWPKTTPIGAYHTQNVRLPSARTCPCHYSVYRARARPCRIGGLQRVNIWLLRLCDHS